MPADGPLQPPLLGDGFHAKAMIAAHLIAAHLPPLEHDLRKEIHQEHLAKVCDRAWIVAEALYAHGVARERARQHG
jgi:hypothetical protein